MTDTIIDSDGGASAVGRVAKPEAAQPVATGPAMTAVAAQAELRRMAADRAGPLFAADHPQHGEAAARFAELSAIARGETPDKAALAAAVLGVVDADANAQMLAAANAEAEGPPATPEGYSVARVAIPAGGDLADDRAVIEMSREVAHKAALSQTQFDTVARVHAELQRISARGDAAVARFVDDGLVGLRRIWGAEFETNLAGAQAWVRAQGDELAAILEAGSGRARLGNAAQVIRFCAERARAAGFIK